MISEIIITGPSASGKTTIIRHLLQNKSVKLSISYTSRKPRQSETNHVEYHFVSKREFEQKIAENFFIEYVYFNNNYYGTGKIKDQSFNAMVCENNGLSNTFTENILTIYDVETEGIRFYKEYFPNAVFWLVCPSKDALEVRLMERGVKEPELSSRLATFYNYEEIKNTFGFDELISTEGSKEETYKIVDELISKLV